MTRRICSRAAGSDQKDMFKGGWLFAIIGCVISVGWIMTVLPVL